MVTLGTFKVHKDLRIQVKSHISDETDTHRELIRALPEAYCVVLEEEASL